MTKLFRITFREGIFNPTSNQTIYITCTEDKLAKSKAKLIIPNMDIIECVCLGEQITPDCYKNLKRRKR